LVKHGVQIYTINIDCKTIFYPLTFTHMTTKTIIVGNWKMHGTPELARSLVSAISAQSFPPDTHIIICPPTTLLATVAPHRIASRVAVGGQDCSAEAEGAFTGDISAAMLKEAGCDYVIIGHSERRQYHGESDALVQKKAARAIAAGLIPIICVGETAAERQAGKAEEVIGGQLKASLPKATGEGNFMLAYEPIWAIGSGKTPTAADIEAMHAHILAVAAKETGLAPSQFSVLYGGSVKAANAAEILAISGVSGVLVGGASLKANEFCAIAAAAAGKG